MSGAPIGLFELRVLGFDLWEEAGELCLRAPPGSMNDDMRARIRASKPALLGQLRRLAIVPGAVGWHVRPPEVGGPGPGGGRWNLKTWFDAPG